MIRAVICATVASAVLMGCEDNSDRIPFEGQFYRAKLKADRDAREAFVVEISPVSRGVKGALEAGRYEATDYCVNTYGSSRIEWIIGPDQDPESVIVDNDTIELSGSCPS